MLYSFSSEENRLFTVTVPRGAETAALNVTVYTDRSVSGDDPDSAVKVVLVSPNGETVLSNHIGYDSLWGDTEVRTMCFSLVNIIAILNEETLKVKILSSGARVLKTQGSFLFDKNIIL